MTQNDIHEQKMTDKGVMKFGRTHKITNEQDFIIEGDRGQWEYSLKTEYGLPLFLAARATSLIHRPGSLSKKKESVMRAANPHLARMLFKDIFDESPGFTHDDIVRWLDRMALVTLTVESVPKQVRGNGQYSCQSPKSVQVWLPLFESNRTCQNITGQGREYDGLTASLMFGVCYYQLLGEVFHENDQVERGDFYYHCCRLLNDVVRCHHPKSYSVLN